MLEVFRELVGPEQLTSVVTDFEGRDPVEIGEDVSSADYVALVESMPSLARPVTQLAGADATPGQVASAVELILEGLHLSKRLNKDAVSGRAQYRARG